jgi:hypothetical protein
MSEALSLELRTSIHWLLQDAQGLSSIADSARLEYQRTMDHGTSQLNMTFADWRSMPSLPASVEGRAHD